MISMSRPRAKYDRIAADLRDAIVSGRFQPGDQLPKWDEMEQQYEVGRPTLTKALERLKRDGFLRATRARGTFVTARPPHLARFGIVLPSSPAWSSSGKGVWNRFWELLAATSPGLESDLDIELPVFYEVADNATRGAQRLAADLRRGRLGGLIIVGSNSMRNLPELASAPVPRVAIFDAPEQIGCPCVYVDSQSFVDRSLRALRERGCKRVAVLTNESATFAGFERGLSDSGFESRPYWRLVISPASARNVVRLLLDYDHGRTPDALVIADDNLVDEGLAGVLAAGRRVPDDLTVVTHCNWPRPTGGSVATVRLGYDVRAILRTCVDLLLQQTHGRTPPPITRLPALAAEEVGLDPDVWASGSLDRD